MRRTRILGDISSVTSGTATQLPGALHLPNGSASAPSLTFTNDTDVGFYYSATQIGVTVAGTQAWSFRSDGGLENVAGADAILAAAAITTTATSGFTFIPSCPGTPTGVPANLPTGTAALVWDSSNGILYAYAQSWSAV